MKFTVTQILSFGRLKWSDANIDEFLRLSNPYFDAKVLQELTRGDVEDVLVVTECTLKELLVGYVELCPTVWRQFYFETK